MHHVAYETVESTDRERSLDNRQTTRQKPTQSTLERGFTLATFQTEIKNVERLIQTNTFPDSLRRRLSSCGTDAWVQCSPSTHRWRVRSNHCGSRVCPRCRFNWSRRVREQLEARLQRIATGRASLLTLTIKSSNAPLQLQIANLYNAFRRLRSKPLWRKNVSGWFCVLEITWNADRRQWHPHLHLVLDAGFMHQHALSKLWLTATRGSRIIDIRRIKETSRTAKYLTSYLTKANGLNDTTELQTLAELYATYQKARLYRAGGTLKTTAEIDDEPDDYPHDWKNVYSLLEFLQLLDAGSPDALEINDLLHSRKPPSRSCGPPDVRLRGAVPPHPPKWAPAPACSLRSPAQPPKGACLPPPARPVGGRKPTPLPPRLLPPSP